MAFRFETSVIRTLSRILQPALGLPCWQVRWDAQVGLDLTFGSPRLELGKPRNLPPDKSDEVIRTRPAYLFGTHWLGLGADAWSIQFTSRKRIGPQSSARQKDMAVSRLSGQILEVLDIELDTGATFFAFDLGALVTARPPRDWRSHQNDDLWTFRSATDEIEVRLRAAWTHRPVPGRTSTPRPLADGQHKHLIIGKSRINAI